MTLRDAGFRFARVAANDYRWLHPADMRDGYIDCTDMPYAEFRALVAADQGVTL